MRHASGHGRADWTPSGHRDRFGMGLMPGQPSPTRKADGPDNALACRDEGHAADGSSVPAQQ